jgi:hypothetical protein
MDRSYVVRVYRNGNCATRGVVEDIASNSRESFSSPEELWRLLASPLKQNVQAEVVPLTLASACKKESKKALPEDLAIDHQISTHQSSQ